MLAIGVGASGALWGNLLVSGTADDLAPAPRPLGVLTLPAQAAADPIERPYSLLLPEWIGLQDESFIAHEQSWETAIDSNDAAEPGPATVAPAEERLVQLESRLASIERERHLLVVDFLKLQGEVTERKREISARERAIADLVASQASALARIVEQTTASIDALSKLVARTGINPDRLIAAVRNESGLGGPFLQPGAGPGAIWEATADPFTGPMQRLEALRRALDALPLESPLAEFRIIGHYGLRRDPITGQPALHAGIDLGAPMRTPVFSTAPGIVVAAGWQNEFGNLVEIDHGYGIHTRYAHLARVDVNPGDVVGTRVQVGTLGNTGRSTGPHLHYEVLFEGESLDPLRFLEARRQAVRATALRRSAHR